MEQHKYLFEDAPIPCHHIGLDGAITRVNRAECRLLGYTEAELLGKPVWDCVASPKQRLSKAGVTEKLSGARPLIPFEREYLRSDGEQILVEVHEQYLRDEQGAIAGLASWLLDRTEHSIRGAVQREELRWLRAIFESLPYGIVTADSMNRVRSMNAAAERITGFSEMLARGKDIELVIGDLADALGDTQQVLFSESGSFSATHLPSSRSLLLYRLDSASSVLGFSVLIL
jgi:PAS domain S-box-containing protein